MSEAYAPVRWHDWFLPITVGFVVGCAVAPLVRLLIALLVRSFAR